MLDPFGGLAILAPELESKHIPRLIENGLVDQTMCGFFSASLRAAVPGWSIARLGVSNAIVIEVVPFSDEHQAGVIDVILPIQQSEFGISITLEDQPDLRDIPGFYQRGSGNFWVALAGAQVVGTIGLLDIGHAQGALRKMFVRAEYRGPTHQVARRLLETLLGWCREKQIREVFLGTTAKFLAAHRFYEKWGFAEIPQTELPAAFPVMSVDTKFYVHIIPTGDPRPPDSADAPQTTRG